MLLIRKAQGPQSVDWEIIFHCNYGIPTANSGYYHDDNEDRQRKDVYVMMDIEYQRNKVRRINLGHELEIIRPENARTVDI